MKTRVIIAAVLCVFFLWSALVVWNLAFKLADMTGLSYHVFDGIAFGLGFLSLVSTEIANEHNYKDKQSNETRDSKHSVHGKQ